MLLVILAKKLSESASMLNVTADRRINVIARVVAKLLAMDLRAAIAGTQTAKVRTS